uniref:Uncharacterized protein n=1 Tax=Tanacetum cinerariifolium TaxID=118510 RepID=A0A699UPL9_TANCI|nr:hypothetical protein [Tanacetum cinerariifolium]
MYEELKPIYKALESRYVHEGKTIDPTFYEDLNEESLAKFTNIGFDYLLSLDVQICHRLISIVIKENVYSVIENKDHDQASFAMILYCLETGRPFTLA